jgi:hypothetical protein
VVLPWSIWAMIQKLRVRLDMMVALRKKGRAL